MADNNTDIMNKLKGIFGSSKNLSTEDDNTAQNLGSIEKDAKSYYSKNHALSIEQRIKGIHENALNTYAKEEDELSEPEDKQSEFSDNVRADDNLFVGVDHENDESYINQDQLTLDDQISNCEKTAQFGCDVLDSQAGENKSDIDEDVELSGTRDYDMAQLLKILNSDKNDYDEDELYEKPKKKKKRNKLKEEYEKELEDEDNEAELTESESVNEHYYDYEFTQRHQSADMFKSFRKSAVVASISLVVTLLLTVLSFWVELAGAKGLPFADMMRPGYYGRVFSMTCLEILALCIFFNLDGLLRGVRKLSLKKASAEGVAVISCAVCVLHTVYTCIFEYTSYTQTYCYMGCFVLLLLSFNTFVKSYTRFKAFSILLSKKPKLTTEKLEALSEENAVFERFLGEDSDVMTVTKTDIVSDFVKRTHTIPKAQSRANLLVYISLVAGIIVAVVLGCLLGESSYNSITKGVGVFLLSSPITYLIVTALPYFVSSIRAFRMHNAILGEAACDSYENTDVLSFDDTEVFPPKAVKVTSIKTYNGYGIDKVIVYMANVFEKLGGPLSYVFSSSIQSYEQDKDAVVTPLEIAKDGVHVQVGNDDILVGTGNYLRMYGVEAAVDLTDESEMRSLTSVTYLVCNGLLAAKFYIRYSVSKRFESLLKSFYDAGICCGIRTSDPGVDNQLVSGSLKGMNYPVGVINKNIKDLNRVHDSLNTGGLIGISGLHNYLKCFVMLDKLRGIYKTNSVFSIIATIVGLAFSVGLMMAQVTINPIVFVLFHAFWSIPLALVSLLEK